jgi:hypothetical protein
MKTKISKKQKERLEKALKNFKELKKEIAPFTPKQQGGRYSRREEWCDSSCLNFGHLVQKQKAA